MKIRTLLYLAICLAAGTTYANPGTAASVAAEAVEKQLQASKKVVPYANNQAADHSKAKTEVEKLATKLISPANLPAGSQQ